jgi:hypothetical protein
MLDVRLGCFGGVVRGMVMMAVGQVRVMRGQLMSAGLVMVRCFLVVPRCVFVMFCCLVMMFRCLFGHSESSNRVVARLTKIRDAAGTIAFFFINGIQNPHDCAVNERSNPPADLLRGLVPLDQDDAFDLVAVDILNSAAHADEYFGSGHRLYVAAQHGPVAEL